MEPWACADVPPCTAHSGRSRPGHSRHVQNCGVESHHARHVGGGVQGILDVYGTVGGESPCTAHGWRSLEILAVYRTVYGAAVHCSTGDWSPGFSPCMVPLAGLPSMAQWEDWCPGFSPCTEHWAGVPLCTDPWRGESSPCMAPCMAPVS